MAEKKTYEAMFLLDAGAGDFETAADPVRKVLQRNEAEVLSLKPWDERKLAFEIQGRKRGLYVLSYFKADPLKIVEMEHDCRLEERIVRVLILKKDRLTQEQIDAPTPATEVRLPPPAPAEAVPGAVVPAEAAPAPRTEEEIAEFIDEPSEEK